MYSIYYFSLFMTGVAASGTTRFHCWLTLRVLVTACLTHQALDLTDVLVALISLKRAWLTSTQPYRIPWSICRGAASAHAYGVRNLRPHFPRMTCAVFTPIFRHLASPHRKLRRDQETFAHWQEMIQRRYAHILVALQQRRVDHATFNLRSVVRPGARHHIPVLHAIVKTQSAR
ncbi:hypothetical protein L210DRAFT_2970377 [Boletus edulis BED1]|uniref:Uncharacterized protein n=1 Tax=Boletus edulis BED1 TaxID=1328754 RepID=A0AAD4GIQ9_BOLED|nr:hypothetical protein L210DRAFT_2970377 [Boletus edulis BED1]